jgi:Tfp pilus assembly protein PilX
VEDIRVKTNMNKQQGMATIIVVVVILVVITLMVVFAARVGLFDQRMTANQLRQKDAFSAAEAGLNFASAKFESEFKRTYDDTNSAATLAAILASAQFAASTGMDGLAAGANESSFVAAVTDAGVSGFNIPIYTAIASGASADGTGSATVQRQFTLSNVFGGSVPDVPVIVGGSVGTGGNFNVVANPNGGGDGVPVSIWSNDDVTATSSSATCHFEFYDGNNAQCSNPSGHDENISTGTNPATAISTYDETYPDILPNDSNFPTDLFNFLFGVSRNDWASKEAQAAQNNQSSNSCADLIAAGTSAGEVFPLWWIDGDCDITGGAIIGSEDYPVVIVVSDGELKITGGGTTYGVVYLFDNPDTVGSPTASLGGGPEIIGSFVSDVGGNAMSGSYAVVYDPTTLDNFLNNGNSYTFGWVPDSWRDF